MFKTAYPNFDRELKIKRFTVRSLALHSGMKYMTLYAKVKNGKNLTIDEALLLKATLESDLPIEELFEKKVAI